MKVILCGYNWTGCKALDLLMNGNNEIFVYTHETPSEIPSLISLCKKHKIPFSTQNISKAQLPFIPDIICSIYYRFIISKPIIDVVKGKIFNLHPSLLPMYRGCSSVTWALINGESKYGFTYHYIDNGCDTGNILIQKELPIEEWDTQMSLYYKVMFASMKYFQKAFSMVVKGEKGTIQRGKSSYYPRGCPYNGVINPLKDIEYIERFIRAMYFPPYKPAIYENQEIRSIEEYLALLK